MFVPLRVAHAVIGLELPVPVPRAASERSNSCSKAVDVGASLLAVLLQTLDPSFVTVLSLS
jgi:hypothetical protein